MHSCVLWIRIQLSHNLVELGLVHDMGSKPFRGNNDISKNLLDLRMKNNKANANQLRIVVHGPLVYKY